MKEFKSKKNLISIITALILCVIFVCSCSFNANRVSNDIYTSNGFYFDTLISISIYDRIPQNEADEILAGCMNLCQKYENLFSKSIETSDIYQINHSNGKPVTVSKETFELIKESCDIAQKSNGTVDPTIGAVSQLWDFKSTDSSIPAEDSISNALKTVDYNNILLDEHNVSICLSSPETSLDLGFIAKGYIADSVKDYLLSKNITSAIINLGGNILCIGNNVRKDNSPFTIGIKDPADTQKYLKAYAISDRSIVSSGDYERYFEIGNHRYHHILSTKNGYPADSVLSQVTVISDKSLLGDKLSTLLYILGPDEGCTFVDKYYPDCSVIFVYKDGTIFEYNL